MRVRWCKYESITRCLSRLCLSASTFCTNIATPASIRPFYDFVRWLMAPKLIFRTECSTFQSAFQNLFETSPQCCSQSMRCWREVDASVVYEMTVPAMENASGAKVETVRRCAGRTCHHRHLLSFPKKNATLVRFSRAFVRAVTTHWVIFPSAPSTE